MSSPRGTLRARVRISGIRDGVLFVPFHYGYWDREAGTAPQDKAHDRAANELTPTDWDPVSKQPLFKTAAAAVERISETDGRPSAAPTTTASAPVTGSVPPTAGGDDARAEELVGGRS